jgi:hypothetical protein
MDIFDEIVRDAKTGDMPTNTELAQIKDMVSAMLELDDRIAKGTRLLDTLKKQRDHLSEVGIPAKMAEVGLSKLTLDTGQTLELKPEVYASIRADLQEEAFNWLEEHDLGDVIKSEVILVFGRGEEEKTTKLLDLLQENEYGNFTEKKSVHASTLKALIKEQRAKGKEFPEKYFSIADITKSVIKAPKLK